MLYLSKIKESEDSNTKILQLEEKCKCFTVYKAKPVKRLKRKAKTGYKISEKKKIKTISKIREYCSSISKYEWYRQGKREKRIFEPSSGGIGTKLNIPKARFIITIVESIK